LRLAQPIVGMTATPDGSGYWFVARDGGIFSYGSARFFGSGAGTSPTPVVGIAAARTGDGYRVVYADGRVTGFGNAITYDASPMALTRPLVGAAVHS